MEDFESLELGISLFQHCNQQDVNILQIKDNGPGMTFQDLREAMTGEITSSKMNQQGFNSDESSLFSCFKFAALNLACHTLVISKTLVKKDNLNNQEQVHIGMLSSQFIKDSGS